MLFTVLCTLIAVHGNVLSEVPPAPPQKVYVDNWLLRWTPAIEDGEGEEVSYTVEYSSFGSDVWTDVPACVHISLNSCNVTSTKAEDELGCVMLRVQAERRGLTSTPVKACSRHGDSCTPDFSLTAGKDSLTVHLNRTHSLALQYGDSAKYRVYYGKKGERLQKYKDDVASVTIHGLQEGQLYCTEVQYVYYDVPVGLATCTQCEVISMPREDSKQSKIIAAVVLVVVVLLVLMPVLAYFLIFHHGTIKRMLHLPYHIPEDFFLEPFPKNHLPIHSHTEEHYHVISSISPEERRE